MLYLGFKLLHIAAVILFLGNIITGLFWKAHADRTRNPQVIAHAMSKVWELWGLFALLTPVAAVALMVFKPALPAF